MIFNLIRGLVLVFFFVGFVISAQSLSRDVVVNASDFMPSYTGNYLSAVFGNVPVSNTLGNPYKGITIPVDCRAYVAGNTSIPQINGTGFNLPVGQQIGAACDSYIAQIHDNGIEGMEIFAVLMMLYSMLIAKIIYSESRLKVQQNKSA